MNDDVDELKKEGLFIDMHFHTNYSDGSTRLKTIERICRKNKIGVSITDHNEIKGCLNASGYNFKLIPGIETRSRENIDLLFYFYDIGDLKEFYGGVIRANMVTRVKYRGLRIDALDILELSKDYNCISCIPHPFSLLHFAGIKKVEEGYKNKSKYKDGVGILKMADAVEVMNGHLLKRGNLKALELAHYANKSYTGGSDGHIRFDLGKILTYARAEDTEEFLRAVLSKKNQIYVFNGGLRRMIVSRTWALRKHVRHPVHYINRFIKFSGRKIKKDG